MNPTTRGLQPIHAIGGSELPATGLPTSIMWMPPGTHTITANQGGKPAKITVTVNAESAATVENARREYQAAADAGHGDRAYFDLNHNDEDASGHPVSFYWGGDDPKAGGVRAKVEWSDAGASAVRGRAYRRFSPSFYASDGKVIGAPVNMGGLVNRAAFQNIAPILDGADFLAAKAIGEAIRGIQGSNDFITAAQAIAGQRGLDPLDAYEVLAKESPESYERYREGLGLRRSHSLLGKGAPLLRATTAQGIAIVELAGAIAAKAGTDPADELAAIADANPAFYNSYRASLGLGPLVFQQEQVDVWETVPFLKKVREVKEQFGISESAAYKVVAEKFPELWEDYRHQVAGPDPSEVLKEL